MPPTLLFDISKIDLYNLEFGRDAIAEVKQVVSIPVIGNGDVQNVADIERLKSHTGCDAVMIGRAAMGNPLIFREIKHYLEHGELLGEPSVEEKIELVRSHAELMIEEFGEERGVIKMRRFLGWYVKGMRGAAAIRPQLFQVASLDDIDQVFAEFMKKSHGLV